MYRDVYLYHIDTLWIKHLDEMEELRDKVGLMWYAQLDPLVIYKSEAYDKFQNLLYRLKVDVTSYIASIDFTQIQQQQAPTITLGEQSDEWLLKMLQEVSKQVKPVDLPKYMNPEKIFADKKATFSSDDGVEIFEVGNDDVGVGTPEVVDTTVKHKPRPNDPCPCGSGKKYKKCHGA